MKLIIKLICGMTALIMCVSLSACSKPNKKPEKQTEPQQVISEQVQFDPAAVFTETKNKDVYEIDALHTYDGKFYNSVAMDDHHIAAVCTLLKDDHATVQLVIFDIEKNEITATVDLDGDQCSIGFLPDGTVYAGSSYSNVINIYNIKGEKVNSYTEINGCYNAYIDNRGRLWAFNDNVLHCFENGKDTYYQTTVPGDYPSVISVDGDRVYISYTVANSETAIFDVSTGRTLRCELLDDYIDSGSYMFKSDGNSFSYAKDDTCTYSFEWNGGRYDTFCSSNGNKIYLTDDNKIARYNADKSQMATINNDNKVYLLAATPAAAIYVTSAGDSEQSIFYWKDTDQGGQEVKLCEKTLSEDEKNNIKKAQILGDKFGLTIRGTLLPEGTAVGSFTVSADGASSVMGIFLDRLEECLEKYPDGFIESLKNDRITNIEFMCCNGLTGSEGSISAAGAITDMGSSTIFVVFDISDMSSLDSNLAHEFMHVIEDSLEMKDFGSNLFAGWDQLNPEGFTYADRYVDDEGNNIGDNKYTWQLENDYSDIWFIDTYSKTYAKEDRARIFENMNVLSYESVFYSEHIRKKAEYISDLLRINFPSWYEDGEPEWEKFRSIKVQ